MAAPASTTLTAASASGEQVHKKSCMLRCRHKDEEQRQNCTGLNIHNSLLLIQRRCAIFACFFAYSKEIPKLREGEIDK